jgi:tetratricopeptide (TPR) repeat protein
MGKATHKQPFIGIWYHDNNLSSNQQHKVKVYLNRTFYYYRIFIVEEEFYEYLDKERLVAKIFLIISVSDSSLDSLVKLTKESSEKFEKVYIFLPKKAIAPAYRIIIDMDDLFEQISNDIDGKINTSNRAENILYSDLESITTFHIDKDLPALSAVNSELPKMMPIRCLSKQSLRFICYLIMRNILIQKSYNEDDLIEMWASSRDLHQNDKAKLQNIDKLQMNYDKEQVIRYYTKPSLFLFRTINEVCGTESIEQIYKFRSYIRDLHNKLDQVGDDEEQKENIKPFIGTLYRGKLIAGSVLQQLMDNEGGLISMNGFLSTTTDREVALEYTGLSQNEDPGMKSTLFLLQIDQKVSQPYAHIGDHSDVKDENEVLFSLGTIWRIKSITHDKDLYTIELTSCEQLDPESNRLSEKYTGDNATFISLGDILHELGDENEAEWCYRKMLDQHPNDDEIAGILYYKIGMIQFEKKLYFEAFKNLIKSASLLRQSEYKQNMATSLKSIYKYCAELPLLKIYNNIGFILEKNGKFKEAAEHYEQALEEKSSHTERVIAYRNFGLLHFRLGNYNAAKEHHEKALSLMEINDICSQEFRNCLKRINDHLDSIADNEEHKRKKQKTTK